MPIGSCHITINGRSRSVREADVWVAAYDAEIDAFKRTESVPAGDGALEAVRSSVRFGEFFFLAVSSGAAAEMGEGFFEGLEVSFGLTQWRPLFDDRADHHYWAFARRGELAFVPREQLASPSAATVIGLRTDLWEVTAEDNDPVRPVTFAGKVRGADHPKPHRAFFRRSTSQVAPPSATDEITQSEYEALARPDMNGIKLGTGTLYEDPLAGPDQPERALGDGWVVGEHNQGTPASETPGVRRYKGALVFGPSAVDFRELDFAIEGADDYEAGHESAATQRPVAQRRVVDAAGLVLEGALSTNDPSASAFCVSAYRDGTRLALEWADGFGFSVRPSTATAGSNLWISDGVGGGASPYHLAADRVTFEAGKRYRFRLVLGDAAEGPEGRSSEAVTASLWLWEDGHIRPDDPTIETGSYAPANRRRDGGQLTNSDHVGAGCDRCALGSAWALQAFRVSNTTAVYPQALFELDLRGQRRMSRLTLTARGRSWDGALSHGHALMLWEDGAWRVLEEARYDGYRFHAHNVEVELSPGATEGGRAWVAVTTLAPHHNQSEARIEVDHVRLRSEPSPRYVGGKSDVVFVQSPDGLWRPSREREVVVPDAGSLIRFGPDTPLKSLEGADVTVGGPVEEVTEAWVATEGQSGYAKAEKMVPGVEYRAFWNDPALRGSMTESMSVAVDPAFTGFPIALKLRVHDRVQAVHEFLTTSDRRKVDADVLARHRKSVFVDVWVRHTGAAPEGALDRVRKYVFEAAGEEISAFDLIGFLRGLGVRGILQGAEGTGRRGLELSARRIDDEGNTVSTPPGNFVTKQPAEAFVPGAVKLIATKS